MCIRKIAQKTVVGHVPDVGKLLSRCMMGRGFEIDVHRQCVRAAGDQDSLEQYNHEADSQPHF